MILTTRVFQLGSMVLFLYKRNKITVIINLIALGISSTYELMQIANLGLIEYLRDPMNFVDFPSYISGIFWINSYHQYFKEAKSSFQN